jgi:hypothetical protein
MAYEAFWEPYADRIEEREDPFLFVTWMDACIQPGTELDRAEDARPGSILESAGWQVLTNEHFIGLAMERDREKRQGGYRHILFIPTPLVIQVEEISF